VRGSRQAPRFCSFARRARSALGTTDRSRSKRRGALTVGFGEKRLEFFEKFAGKHGFSFDLRTRVSQRFSLIILGS